LDDFNKKKEREYEKECFLKMEGEFKEKIDCAQTFPQLSEN